MTDSSESNHKAQAFFHHARERFDAVAARQDGIVVRTLCVAGYKIRVEVSSGELADAIHPALSHLVVPDAAEPDFTIGAWDSETTGAPPLSPQWPTSAYGRHGFIAGFNDARFHTAVQIEPVIFRILDMEARRALYWTASARAFPYWEYGAPLRPVLHEWLRRKGVLAVHGGAVGFHDGGVLIAGSGGRGKSNLALACLASDLLYASDDFCCVSRDHGWTVHSLYCTGKMAPQDMARHPHLAGAQSNLDRFGNEKTLFFLNPRFAHKLVRSMPLRAIVLPKIVSGAGSKLVPATAAEAQRAIATSTIELSRWTARDTFRDVAALVRDLPSYELQIGTPLAEAPARIAELLDGLR